MSIPCTYLNCEDTFECRNLLRVHIGIHKASTNGEYNFTCIYIYIYIYIINGVVGKRVRLGNFERAG